MTGNGSPWGQEHPLFFRHYIFLRPNEHHEPRICRVSSVTETKPIGAILHGSTVDYIRGFTYLSRELIWA